MSYPACGINGDKSRERCYVLLNILFPCLRFLRLEDSNIAGVDKVYYYPRMKKLCIEKTKPDLDYQRVFPDISSPANIWNMSDEFGILSGDDMSGKTL